MKQEPRAFTQAVKMYPQGGIMNPERILCAPCGS